MEVIALPFSLHEVASLNNEAGQARKDVGDAMVFAENIGNTNAQLVSDNLVLRSNVVALEEKLKPRSISKNAKQALSLWLKNTPKGHIEIIMSDKDAEAIFFGVSMRSALTNAGCPVDLSPRTILNFEQIPQMVESGSDFAFVSKIAFSIPEYALVINKILEADGFKQIIGGIYDNALQTNSIKIYILPKPPKPDD